MRILHIIATTAFISLVSSVSFASGSTASGAGRITKEANIFWSADEVSKSLICKVNGVELMAKTSNDCKAAGGEIVKDKK